jgi:phosphoglycolate phosphatase-like HAD superfamily hydrolase
MAKASYFRALLLDLDGTIVDSRRLAIASTKYAVSSRGRKPPTTRQIEDQLARTTSPTRILNHFRIHDSEDYWDYYESHLGKLRLLDSRVKGKLVRISKSGADIGLVTSLPGKVANSILAHFKIDELFGTVRTALWRTPKWKLINRAIDDLGVECDDDDIYRALYVGDRPSDIKAASNAGKSHGMWSGLAFWSNQEYSDFVDEEPDFVFRKFDEIVELFTTRIANDQDCYTPAKDCYSLHERYLPAELLINRSSCNYCRFSSDCLNCARFEEVSTITPDRSHFTDLSNQIGITVRSCEWYYPKNYTARISNPDSKDTRNVLANFKNGYREYKFRLGLSLAQHFEKFSKRLNAFRGINVILPIPSTRKKIAKRGYNPPEELAKMLGQLTGIRVRTDCLATTSKRSRRQTRYSHEWEADKERLKRNIEVRFKRELAGKKILLLDDVLTDGVTLAAYSERLLEEVRPRPRVAGMTFGLTFKER